MMTSLTAAVIILLLFITQTETLTQTEDLLDQCDITNDVSIIAFFFSCCVLSSDFSANWSWHHFWFQPIRSFLFSLYKCLQLTDVTKRFCSVRHIGQERNASRRFCCVPLKEQFTQIQRKNKQTPKTPLKLCRLLSQHFLFAAFTCDLQTQENWNTWFFSGEFCSWSEHLVSSSANRTTRLLMMLRSLLSMSLRSNMSSVDPDL